MKRVLVTGASRGIGRAIAEKLAADGFNITVHYRSGKEGAEQAAAEISKAGGHANLLQFDVSDRAQTRAALEQDIAENGAYWGVVCNAGITRDNAFPALSEEDWDNVIHTNLDSFYNVIHPLVMPMIQLRNGGRIVTIASVSGIAGNRGQVNYSASKAGLIGATKALALELAKRKITVNCVAPGLIGTDMVDDRVANEIMNMIPMRRAGTVEEVAATTSFLFSNGAAYMTRQVLSVNGGLI
ncbi:3-ketoacyl-ACP reductase FabG2 [Aliidiomarina indica]|uniref:3-ketoacyl-ACP reductase FabG2 n=1 Tax=Aliidiomarina indica TaxID=2749147 RepID=UPI00188EDDA4|nr:3-ketoacyl-ACP reductase FabG2 [Aliidiomarina indica]